MKTIFANKLKNRIKAAMARSPRLYHAMKGLRERYKQILVHTPKSCLIVKPTNSVLNLEECRRLPLVLKSKPPLVYAEICTYCNLNCRMCGRAVHGMKKEDQGFMKREIFDKLTELFTPGGTLALFGRGETLLHPEFIYFLKSAKDRGMKVSFNSNGKALNKEIALAMVKYMQDSITFSCSAGTAKTYEAIHRGGKWDHLWSNIAMLNEAKKLHGFGVRGAPVIYLEFVSQMDNIKELPLLVQRALEWELNGLLVIDVVAHSPELEKQRMNIPENIPTAEEYYTQAISIRDKLKKLNPNFDLRLPSVYNPLTKKFMDKSEVKTFRELNLKLEQKPGCGQDNKMCIEPWQTFYARFDGMVAPCVITNRNLGDLNTQSAMEIWNGQEFQKFRSRMRSENKPFECLRCHLFPGPQRYDNALDNAEEYEAL
ncbi:MAG: radical SAM protein [Sedimentisphaerales bacterium]|nr:radical SAM protein [Sedimentisphaerales bacterium]